MAESSLKSFFPLRNLIILILLILLALIPIFLPNVYYLRLIQIAFIFGVIALGLDLLVGHAGLISLGHAGLFAIGAYTSSLLALKLNFSFWLALPLATIATAIIGFLLGIPSFRLTGVYLAMTTIALNIIVHKAIILMPELTRAAEGLQNIPMPNIGEFKFNVDNYYYIILAILIGVMFLLRNFYRSSWGKIITCIRESELAANFMGNSVYRYKLLIFVISAAIAGLAGSLYAHLMGYINEPSFTWENSILMLLMVIVGGRRELLGPLIGALLLTWLPQFVQRWDQYRHIAYGFMIIFFLLAAPAGIVGELHILGNRLFSRKRKKSRDKPSLIEPSFFIHEDNLSLIASEDILNVKGISKSFGGVKALNKVDLLIKPGTIHALIGPNGSGKTTLVNVITGLYKPDEGEVTFRTLPIVGLSPDKIALLGIARTFQTPSVSSSLNVAENMLVAIHQHLKTNLLITLLGLPQSARKKQKANEEIYSLLKEVGLEKMANFSIAQLPHGYLRLLEIARALALRPQLLVVDEPAAGLSQEEVDHLGKILKNIRRKGIAILLIEHNVDFIMSLADFITVLDFGKKIAEGEPIEIRNNPIVLEAYLGKGRSITHA